MIGKNFFVYRPLYSIDKNAREKHGTTILPHKPTAGPME